MRKCIGCGVEGEFSPKQSRCKVCIAKQNRDYYEANKNRIKEQTKAYRLKHPNWSKAYMKEYSANRHREFKMAALAVYGISCACCGEDQIEFLTLDHVDNDGHVHRRQINQSNFYWWLNRNGFPKQPRLQTLCFNCNFAKHTNGGVCPHQSLKVQRLERKLVGPSGSKREAPLTEAMI